MPPWHLCARGLSTQLPHPIIDRDKVQGDLKKFFLTSRPDAHSLCQHRSILPWCGNFGEASGKMVETTGIYTLRGLSQAMKGKLSLRGGNP